MDTYPNFNIQSTNAIVNQNSTILHQTAYHGSPYNFDRFKLYHLPKTEGRFINDYIVGINKGYKENGKYVTTDNWIVTSFKKGVKGVNDTIAYAGTFTSNTVRSENPFTSEIVIDIAPKVKSVVSPPEKVRLFYSIIAL